MSNLIYQYWDGNVRESVKAGSLEMKKYADRIGCDYIFEDNPRWIRDRRFGNYSAHFGALKPVFESKFDKWEKILFADTDVFPIKNLSRSIFEDMDVDTDIGICTEPFQPKQRKITLGRITHKADEKWARGLKKEFNIDLPRVEDGIKVYNSGVIVYSSKGRENAKKKWISIDDYVNFIKKYSLDSFYGSDQPYVHAMIFHSKMNMKELDNGWNSYIHGTKDIHQPQRRIVDHRNENTKFVHCQFPGADDMSYEDLIDIVYNNRKVIL